MTDGREAPHDLDTAMDEALERSILERLEQLGLIDEPVMASSMLALFIESCRSLLARLEEALEMSCPETCREAAHTLKGTSRNIGARRLGDLSLELQHRGDSENLDGAAAVLAEAQAEFRRVEEFLHHLLEELG